MNDRESKITRKVLSNKDYRHIIINKMAKSQSIIGTKVEVDDKKYTITNGNLDKVNNRIANFKSRIMNYF